MASKTIKSVLLLKALLPVCMKYIAQGESRVANIAGGEANCYICHETVNKSCIFIQTKHRCFKYLLYLHLLMCE